MEINAFLMLASVGLLIFLGWLFLRLRTEANEDITRFFSNDKNRLYIGLIVCSFLALMTTIANIGLNIAYKHDIEKALKH